MGRVTQKDIKDLLEPGEAAIEFIHFQYRSPASTDTILYAAVVLSADAPHAHFIPLFEENQLEALVNRPGRRSGDFVNDLYAVPNRGLSRKKEKKPNLYELIWAPLDSVLQDVEKIYYSPSGLLHRLNLGAISLDEETTIADKYELQAMLSTRQLALDPARESGGLKDAILYGGVEYDHDSTAMISSVEAIDTSTTSGRSKLPAGFFNRTLEEDSWTYLRWTERESLEIYELLQKHQYSVAIRTGNKATEASFKQIGIRSASPRVLHLATHGFFFPDPEESDIDSLLRAKGTETIFKISDHPMIRSGLILAGANRCGKAASPCREGRMES